MRKPVRDRRNGQWWRSDRPWMRRHQPCGSSPRQLGKAPGSEAGRGVAAAGETPTMGGRRRARTDAHSTSRLARWTACWRGPLGGVERPRRVVRFAQFDSSARPRLLADLRSAPPSAAISAWPDCHVRWCGRSGDRSEETAAEPEHWLGSAVRYRLRRAVAAAARQANIEQTTVCSARPNDAAFQQPTARGGRAALAQAPAAHPSPPGWATLGDRLRPLGLDPPAMPPGRRPDQAGTPAVTGPLAQGRQRRRRRITPNANTSTTTMISTHNHVDMAASLVGAGAVQTDATAAHPSKQLGHDQPAQPQPPHPAPHERRTRQA
jgi:hypothetical protein